MIRVAPLAVTAATLGAACTNPTIDPSSTFYAEGKALKADKMTPLANAEVKLIRYFHPAKLLRPSVDDLFECDDTDCGYDDVELEIGVVRKTQTDADGRFSMEFKGEDIAGAGGITDGTGKVEGSNVVIIIRDPADEQRFAGVWTDDHTYQQTDKRWDPGNVHLWDSGATADVSDALNSGLVKLSWNKITRPSGSSVSNRYRVEIRGRDARLVISCYEGTMTEAGGCASNGEKLETSVSAFSVYNFYSTNGAFNAYVTGEGVDYRFRAKFAITGTFQDPATVFDRLPATGIWAVNATENLDLSDSPSIADGNPKTREKLPATKQFKEIYVKLGGGDVVTDAGLLNSLVKDAYSGCVLVEFHGSDLNGVDDAKRQVADWKRKGKFCGANGADNEVSALASFRTSTSGGERASWLRFVAVADGTGSPYFLEIGEVAVYKRK